ncbi:embigin isoform X2 [Sceloporus undulatus]|uniref:embigin isoform X2 n=1 Tax=Sceloporus undulatus TaxID=8520 RepID=UPI001C4AD905|nr:embigin isoform X2 [Sceloporus undulatus]
MMSGCCIFSWRLLLILIALGLLDANSTPDATAETQHVSQQTTESTSDNAASLPERSNTELSTSTQDFDQTATASSLVFRLENITISGFPNTPVTKSVTVEKPTTLELLCSLVIGPSTEVEEMEVAWKTGDNLIKEESLKRTETHTKWCTRYTIQLERKDQMESYMCIFKTKPEINATFHLQVPEIHIKSKSIISYVGDYVVLTCTVGDEAVHYSPSSWVWYTTNGSAELVNIDTTTTVPEKYITTQNNANVTKLKISTLSEIDSGFYWCEAIFPLGESKGNVSLTVLTYMAPLKPFLVIAAEVIVLVAAIFIYEICTKRKEIQVEAEKEFEQAETLKSEDSNGLENSTTRQRKV